MHHLIKSRPRSLFCTLASVMSVRDRLAPGLLLLFLGPFDANVPLDSSNRTSRIDGRGGRQPVGHDMKPTAILRLYFVQHHPSVLLCSSI